MGARRRLSSPWLAGLGLLLVGCGGLLAGLRRDAEPPGPLPVPFSHQRHVDGSGMACLDCHAGAEAEARAGYPSIRVCLECHEGGAGEAEQLFEVVMAGLTDPVAWPTRNVLPGHVLFSHADHAAREIGCDACHGDVGTSERVRTADVRVEQAECEGCHARSGRERPAACGGCHVEGMGAGWKPASHAIAWVERHGPEARAGFFPGHGIDCATCHRESQCTGCHRANPPADHDQRWRERAHGLAASVDRDRCAACHAEDACVRCHAETRPRDHRGAFGAPSNRHCLSCHADNLGESACAVCHKTNPGHAGAPKRLAREGHTGRTDCASCHLSLPHVDDGGSCLRCH